ncbi:hypothetical protein C1646_766393 [Rhizophagus diaphanus]|nr:hypothetical protein C1646_766393 [Rhizophagus diaphanus] [Rhizophagus sp. MUCL 43196]
MHHRIDLGQNNKHIALFANWIERKGNYKYNNNIPYDFELILRGSLDGFDPKSFHYKCDDKGATITVIKIKNLDKIVGGYNPFDWNGLITKNTPDKVSRKGPVFGAYTSIEVSHDLCMQKDGRRSSYPNSYTVINIPKNYFDIVNYDMS